MAAVNETFSVVALPHSCAEDAAFHVSLFVAPKLEADRGQDELSSFQIFPAWGATAKAELRIELFDQLGAIDATALLDVVDPGVWDAAFPPDTPVRGTAVPDWRRRRWRSFAASTVHDLGKSVHLATMYADPTSPPAPAGHPLAGPLEELIREHRYRRPDPHQSGLEPGLTATHGLRMIYDESLMTSDLDGLVESGESLAIIERAIAASKPWLRRVALELHRARRFYERPEVTGEYRDRPLPGAVSPPVPRPEPEFHERVAMAGDHPALMRRLGLVIELRVADPSRLRRSEWLSARVAPGGDDAPCRLTRTRCRAVGDDLVTVAATPDWQDGLARLGDTERFAVLDLEADGTALKLERFLWTLPRLREVHDHDAPSHAATPALRASGFTVARVGQALDVQQRVERQRALEQSLAAGEPPALTGEDVARGLRVEVWDDSARTWHSLHTRRTTVLVAGHGPVLEDAEEEGFVQGTPAAESAGVADGPIHVHEAVFGWEGWSLSAPRPGRRVRHDAGTEVVEDVPEDDPDPVHPILVRNHVAPGTLPRLRFGRSYAMRAWLVDLAGNVRPHELAAPQAADGPDAPLLGALNAALAADPVPPAVGPRLPDGLRAATQAVLTGPAAEPAAPAATTLLADAVHEAIVGRRLRERRGGRAPAITPAPAAIGRRALVARAVNAAVADRAQPFVADTAATTAAALAPLLGAQVGAHPGVGVGAALAAARATVTPLRPFLRWDPVPSPAIVPLRRYTEGESLRVLVVRSGVTQDPETLAVTVTPEAAASERHLAPPKTSQVQAELHGTFDEAIGSPDPADHRRLLGIALLENGSFLDLDVADPDDAPNRTPQPGVRLEMEATTPHADPVTLPLANPGDPLPPGQYVVHDTPELRLPYLPDPLARGLSFVFEEAGLDRAIPFPFGAEGFTARFGGDWPRIEPFRLVVETAEALSGRVDGRVVTIALPPGDVQRFRLASSLRRADLPLFGPWRSLPPSVRDDAHVAEAAADGWLWGLTPFEAVTLVHAVPRPLEAPRPTRIAPLRGEGSTRVTLRGAVDVHGPSTDRLTAEATWTDRVDDITLPKWEDRPTTGVAFTSPVRPFEDLAILSFAEGEGTLPGVGRLRAHAANHDLGDTRHRVIDYTFRASTRFPEYFAPAALAPDPAVPGDDGRSVVGPAVRVSVPSSARPAAPLVHSTVPLLRWSDGDEPEQPVARRHGRRPGVRIFLQRPWFSSGADELLGVLLAPGGDDRLGPQPQPPSEDDGSGFPWVSKWGRDPAWLSAPVERRPLPPLVLDNLLRSTGLDDRPQPGRPVTPPRRLPLRTIEGGPEVDVVGYRPQFSLERNLWYVDVALDGAPAFWPFVRLAVARFQPESIEGCHLSAPARCDFVQLLPERTTSVSRTDDRHVRVVVSGPVGVRRTPERTALGLDPFAAAVREHRQVVARLQRRDPQIPTDLGWETVAVTELVVRGRGAGEHEAAWVGELDAGATIPLAKPGENPDWRVVVEEWERIQGDPLSAVEGAPALVAVPVWERRLVYADEVAL